MVFTRSLVVLDNRPLVDVDRRVDDCVEAAAVACGLHVVAQHRTGIEGDCALIVRLDERSGNARNGIAAAVEYDVLQRDLAAASGQEERALES